ncbi:MAG: methyltransferase domain-containing protein [Planctomycetaceae bacterium]
MTEPFRTDYYVSELAEFYDEHSEYRDRPDVPFFVDEALAAGGPVLEIGCGTGRVLIPTARAGVPIVGLDFSEKMLNTCRAKLTSEPADVQERVRLVHGDMRAFALGETFRLVTLPFRPFQHLLTVPEQLACLRCIRDHLDVGGRLILDVFNPSISKLAEETPGPEFDEGDPFTRSDGSTVQRRARVVDHNRVRQVLSIELIYDVSHPDGRTERLVDPLKMRYFFRYEVEHLLARAGFEVVDLFSGYDRSPLGTKDPGELLFVARKAT